MYPPSPYGEKRFSLYYDEKEEKGMSSRDRLENKDRAQLHWNIY